MCIQWQIYEAKTTTTTATTPWPDKPWQSIQIDIFGEVTAAPHHQRFLLVVHDLHSKWPEIAMTRIVTSTAIIAILDNLFPRWALPEMVTTDNGHQFISEEFEGYCSESNTT